jgi:two-component system LytT family response regulator
MTIYTTIIIDDEPLANSRLKKLLSNFSDKILIIGEAQTGTEAKTLINKLKPDLIFLDIEMPGLTGFELLKELTVLPLVVFCTAYDDYALKAFETNSIDYLVKPLRLERLTKTIEKLERLENKNSQKNLLKIVSQLTAKKEEKEMTSITVKQNDKLLFIKLNDINYFKAEEKYVVINSKKGNFLIEKTLKQLGTKLPKYFLRVHRAIILNINYVETVQKHFNSKYIITMSNKTKITSGRTYIHSIKNWIDL